MPLQCPTGFFITVQVFCLVGMLLLLAAAFLLILYFVTIMIEAKLKRLLISSCLFLVGGKKPITISIVDQGQYVVSSTLALLFYFPDFPI